MALALKRPEANSTQSWLEDLRAVSLFQDVRDDEKGMLRLASIMREMTFQPGQDIIREGATGSEMYFLTRGTASVYKSTAEGEEYKVAIMGGDQHPFFGEGGLLDSDARSATIRAETVCQCLCLDRASFEVFSSEHPQLALPILRRIARAVMGRLRKSNQDLMLLYNALVSEIRGH